MNQDQYNAASDFKSTPATFEPQQPAQPQADSNKTPAIIAYVLYGLGMFAGFLAIIGLILCYVKRGDAAGTIYQSHFQHLITTFWYGLATSILIGLIALATGPLALILGLGIWVWLVYRIIKGFVNVLSAKPI